VDEVGVGHVVCGESTTLLCVCKVEFVKWLKRKEEFARWIGSIYMEKRTLMDEFCRRKKCVNHPNTYRKHSSVLHRTYLYHLSVAPFTPSSQSQTETKISRHRLLLQSCSALLLLLPRGCLEAKTLYINLRDHYQTSYAVSTCNLKEISNWGREFRGKLRRGNLRLAAGSNQCQSLGR
jgi:hypothetical protein